MAEICSFGVGRLQILEGLEVILFGVERAGVMSLGECYYGRSA